MVGVGLLLVALVWFVTVVGHKSVVWELWDTLRNMVKGVHFGAFGLIGENKIRGIVMVAGWVAVKGLWLLND